jgi:hypothetical protein
VASPPPLWAEEVANVNAALEEQRTKYEQSFSNVTLAVHFPAQLRYESPLFYPVAPVSASADDAAQTAFGGAAPGAPDHVLVEFDGRKTVHELRQHLLEQYASELNTLGVAVPASKLVVSVLQSFGQGFYPLSSVEESVSLSEALAAPRQSGRYVTITHVALWDGATLHDEPVLSGLLGYPKQLSVSLLSPGVHVLDEAQVKRGSSGAPGRNGKQPPTVLENKLFPTLFLPSSLSLLEFAHKVCDLCHVDRLHACVSVVCSAPGAQKGERSHVVTPLFKDGVVSGKALASPNNNGASSGMVMTSSSALGEFEELQYVVVEDTENRGLQGGSLAEALVLRKSAEWTVTVEMDFTPPSSSAISPAGDEVLGTGSGGVVTNSVLVSRAVLPFIISLRFTVLWYLSVACFQVDIPRYSSVEELKYTALKLLQLSAEEYGEATRLRSGANRGDYCSR